MEDNFMFRKILDQSVYRQEDISYIEFNICDGPTQGFVSKGTFQTLAEFTDWLHKKGEYSPKLPTHNLTTLGTLRLVIQAECDPATFEPNVITLPHSAYSDMTKTLSLSSRILESKNNVGPFLWSVSCKHSSNKHLQLIYRNVQGMKAGHCQGWELSLAYLPSTRTTTGFFRGTAKSLLEESVGILQSNCLDALHPLVLPSIILTLEMNTITNTGGQCSREWIQIAEEKIGQSPPNGADRLAQLITIEEELLKIHRNIIAKHPETQIEVIKVFERTIDEFSALDTLQDPKSLERRERLQGTLTFNKTKLGGIHADVAVTLSRIEILRSVVQNRLAVALADEQRISDKIKHEASVKFSKNQQTLSILGALFLPGTFFAAIFSTTFFDFHHNSSGIVSKYFWVFWVFTLPTMVALVFFLFWDHIYPGKEKFQCLWPWRKGWELDVLKNQKSNV